MSNFRKIDPKAYTPHGGALTMFKSLASEILIEGPAGTGKTFAVLQKIHMLCEMYPGIRVLFIRKTLKSLRESVLVTWETEVLGEGHSAITGTATRAHRDSYTFENKSHIVLAGIDTPSRHMSTQFDVVAIFEAVECLEDDLEYLLTRCRNWKMPFQQLICDTNPRQPGHWLNKRADRLARQPDDARLPKPKPGTRQMVRVKSRHEDNPFLFDQDKKEWTVPGVDYLAKLSGLHGPRLAWFRDGEWRQAEGLVIPQWSPERNIVGWDDVPPLGWYAAAMDFGFHAPGCFQVWGFTGKQDQPIGEQRMYRVAEVYRRGWTVEQWAQVIMELRQEYPFRVGVADSADPGSIKFLNDYLGHARGRSHGGVIRPCDKSKGIASGLELLRSLIADEPPRDEGGYMHPGGPRLFVVRDSFPYGLETELRSEGKAACFEDEVESLVYPDNDGTKEIKEIPDKSCPDHAIDPARYLVTWAFGKDQTPREEALKPKPGTYGELFGTPALLAKERLAKMFGRGRRRA